MTTVFHIFRYPLDVGSWAVAYYKIHNAGYSNVKGNVYGFRDTCGNQTFREHYLPLCPERGKVSQAIEHEFKCKAEPLNWD